MADDALDVRLRHRFAGSEFTLDAAFTAPPGVTALFGPSGSGKTSVVNAVAGLFRPDGGHIAFGKTVLFDRAARIDRPRHRRGAGYVFQGARLFPHLTVRQNLLFGRRFAREPGPLDFGDLTERLGIAHLLARRPAKLSGGEAQRVAIGRVLLGAPRFLLLDEPLAALDGARKDELLPIIAGLGRDAGLPILYVSHSVPEVVRLARQVVVMEAGRVLRIGTVEDILADASAPDALGPRTGGGLLGAVVRAHHAADGLTELETGGGPLYLAGVDTPIGKALSIRVAAHDVILARKRPEGLSALNVLTATVTGFGGAEGPERVVALALGADRLIARITARSARALDLAPGDACFAIVKVTGIDGEAVTEAP